MCVNHLFISLYERHFVAPPPVLRGLPPMDLGRFEKSIRPSQRGGLDLGPVGSSNRPSCRGGLDLGPSGGSVSPRHHRCRLRRRRRPRRARRRRRPRRPHGGSQTKLSSIVSDKFTQICRNKLKMPDNFTHTYAPVQRARVFLAVGQLGGSVHVRPWCLLAGAILSCSYPFGTT